MIPIIAGHSLTRPGALGYDGVYEHTRTSALQTRVVDKVENYIAITGSCMQILTDDENKNLSRVINLINTHATGPGCDIHFNNNFEGATGIEAIVSKNASNETKRRVEFMVNEGSNILGIPVRRRVPSRDYIYPEETFLGRLAIIDQTKVEMIVFEVCFLNNIDLPKFKGKEQDIANLIKVAHFNKTFNSVVPVTKSFKLEPVRSINLQIKYPDLYEK